MKQAVVRKSEARSGSMGTRFHEFDQYKFMDIKDWRRGEYLPAIGQLLLSPALALVGLYIGDIVAIFVFGVAAALVALSGLGLMFSRRYRVLLNGGWPIDTIYAQIDRLKSCWKKTFTDIEIDRGKVYVWGSPSARFSYALISGSIRSYGADCSIVRKGYFVAHYCYLRHARRPKLKHWQPLALFIEGDRLDAEKKLIDLSFEIRKVLLEICESKHIGLCPDPIFHRPLCDVWCGDENHLKCVSVIVWAQKRCQEPF